MGITMLAGMNNTSLERKILIILDFRNDFFPTYLQLCCCFVSPFLAVIDANSFGLFSTRDGNYCLSQLQLSKLPFDPNFSEIRRLQSLKGVPLGLQNEVTL